MHVCEGRGCFGLAQITLLCVSEMPTIFGCDEIQKYIVHTAHIKHVYCMEANPINRLTRD